MILARVLAGRIVCVNRYTPDYGKLENEIAAYEHTTPAGVVSH